MKKETFNFQCTLCSMFQSLYYYNIVSDRKYDIISPYLQTVHLSDCPISVIFQWNVKLNPRHFREGQNLVIIDMIQKL